MSKHTLNSFFAGIGGFDLGFEHAGIKPVFHCEINKFCNNILKKHWPDVKSHTDITQVTAEELPASEVWCGGFPCQDVSVARGWLGRDGLKGKNTGLFYPFAELISLRKPTVVLMENVSGLLSSHNGKDFLTVLTTLNNLGYSVAWRTLNTRYFGAPQSRPRVYICAWRGNPHAAFNSLYEEGETHIPESARLGFLREHKCIETKACVPEIAFCLAATSGRHTGTDWSRTYISYKKEVRRLTPSECEKLQGFPADWTMPTQEFHQAEARIDSMRYHAIGNAVSVPVVKWVAERICKQLDAKPLKFDQNSIFDEIKSKVTDFSTENVKTFKLKREELESDKIKWASGGFMHNATCITTQTSPAPNAPIYSKLIDILDKKKPQQGYFLSQNAATGILRRVESQNRSLFKPLHAALINLANK